ncbi:MAG: Hsp20/alpha crystallin family protein [Spirochaetia bacterium]
MRYLSRPNNDLDLWNDFSRMMDSFFDTAPSVSHGKFPAVDVQETGKAYILEADLPGMTEKDVKLEVKDNVLTISSEKEVENEEKKEGYLLSERRKTSFSRSFALPRDADKKNIKARFKNGILKLDIPKTEESQPARIEIKPE